MPTLLLKSKHTTLYEQKIQTNDPCVATVYITSYFPWLVVATTRTYVEGCALSNAAATWRHNQVCVVYTESYCRFREGSERIKLRGTDSSCVSPFVCPFLFSDGTKVNQSRSTSACMHLAVHVVSFLSLQ